MRTPYFYGFLAVGDFTFDPGFNSLFNEDNRLESTSQFGGKPLGPLSHVKIYYGFTPVESPYGNISNFATGPAQNRVHNFFVKYRNRIN